MESCLALLFLLKREWTLPEIKVVGRGVDTLVLNTCYADKQFQPIKQEMNAYLQEVLSTLQDEAQPCGCCFSSDVKQKLIFWAKSKTI
jgi:hypothetical protein